MARIITTSSRKNKRTTSKKVLGVIAVVIVAALVASLMLRQTREAVEEIDGHALQNNTAVQATNSVKTVNVEEKTDNSETSAQTLEKPAIVPKEIAKPVVQSVDTNNILNYRDHPASSYIKSQADQIIAFSMQATDATGGMPPLPIMHYPDGGNKMFLDSLTNEIVILDTDSPKVKEKKELMISCRAQIKEIIDNGGTFEEGIKEYQNWVNQNANIRLSAIRKYQELKKEDPDAAEDYLKAINEELQKEGITPIPETGSGRRVRKTSTTEEKK